MVEPEGQRPSSTNHAPHPAHRPGTQAEVSPSCCCLDYGPVEGAS